VNLSNLTPLEKKAVEFPIASSTLATLKKLRDFNPNWQRAFSWVHMKVVNSIKVLKCQYCVSILYIMLMVFEKTEEVVLLCKNHH
jgi:hypothetical protein